MKHAIARPQRRLTSTERAERSGVRPRRLNETENRKARVERMLAVLDNAWREKGHDPIEESPRTVARLREYTDERWHWLAKCADHRLVTEIDDVTAPSDKTRQALLDRLEDRAHDAKLAKACRAEQDGKPRCSSCGAVNCHSVNCAEDCGIRGLPRETYPAEREVVSDREAALGEGIR